MFGLRINDNTTYKVSFNTPFAHILSREVSAFLTCLSSYEYEVGLTVIHRQVLQLQIC